MRQMSHCDLRHRRTWYLSLGNQLTSFFSMNSGLVASCLVVLMGLFHLVPSCCFSHTCRWSEHVSWTLWNCPGCHQHQHGSVGLGGHEWWEKCVSKLTSQGFQICDAKVARLFLWTISWMNTWAFRWLGWSWACFAGYRPVARCHMHLARCASGGVCRLFGCYMKYSRSREHNLIQDWNHVFVGPFSFLSQWHSNGSL